MSTVATAWAQKQTAGSTGRKATLLLLADIASEHGVLWAGVDYLAEILECNRTTIMDNLRKLQASSLIARIERRKPNGARAGTITVLAPTGPRGDMRDPASHELHGDLIREGLSRDSQRGDSPQPKSENPTTLGRDSRPEPLEEPSTNQGAANAAPMAAAPPDPVDEQVSRLCELMSTQVRTTHDVAASSSKGRVAKTWPGACKAMLTVDGYSVAQVEYAIAYVCRNSYWRSRVQSITRLRQEMPEIAKELHNQAQRAQRRLAGQPGDPLAGLSPSARARMERTADRLGIPVEQLMQQQSTRPTPTPNPGQEAPHVEHRHRRALPAGPAGGGGQEAPGAPQPALPVAQCA